MAAPNEQVLEAMYFETVGLDLARAHMTVRNRGAGWTLKLPVAEDNRDEVRVERTGTVRMMSSPGLCGR